MNFWLCRFRIFILAPVFVCLGCSSIGKYFKGLVGGDVTTKRSRKARGPGSLTKRQYKRVKHKDLMEQSNLAETSGSLWVEQGQSSYLFAQNNHRLIGDLLNVGIKGHPKKQLETKVKVIKKLLTRIKKQRAARALARKPKKKKKKKRRVASVKNKNGKLVAAAPAPAPPPPPPPPKEENTEFPIKTVPTRIVEVLKDGNYRIKGDQPFMIDKREYKLIVTGIVRTTDFSDNGLKADELLDPKFDIVSVKRGKKR